jgi:hypothetical protein
MSKNFHEHFDRQELPLPSDRSTGLVFACVALVMAYVWRAHEIMLYTAVGFAAVFATISFAVPFLLRPLNTAWSRFALLINKLINPIVMLLLFVIAIVPAGLIMQLLHDPLRRQRRPDIRSYWIERKQDEHARMTNQF